MNLKLLPSNGPGVCRSRMCTYRQLRLGLIREVDLLSRVVVFWVWCCKLRVYQRVHAEQQCVRRREKERERERERERVRKRKRESGRESERDRERVRKTERESERDRKSERDRRRESVCTTPAGYKEIY